MEFQALLKRRTIRNFSQKPVEKADITAMIEAARCASCASNRQRLRYIGVVSPEKVAAILPHTFYTQEDTNLISLWAIRILLKST